MATTVLAGAQVSPSGIQGPTGTRLPPGWLYGLTLSNNATDAVNDVDIAAGACRDSTDAADIYLGSPLTKRLDVAWTAGNNQGGRDTGAIADGAWHLYIIRNPSTTAIDALFSVSPTAPTMPSGFTQKRRIGAVVRRGVLGINLFVQWGDEFFFRDPDTDLNGGTLGPGTSGNFPLINFGMEMLMHVSQQTYGTAGGFQGRVQPTGLSTGSVFPCVQFAGAATGVVCCYLFDTWTSPIGTIRIECNYAPGAGNSMNFSFSVRGWNDPRGKTSWMMA